MSYSLSHALADTEHLSPSIYDIATAAYYDGPQRNLALFWLLDHRNPDGTWGDALSWQYRYLCTYAAALAFRTGDQKALSDATLAILPGIPNDFPSNWTINFGGQIIALDTYAQAVFGLTVSHPAPVQSDMEYDRRKWEMLITLDLFFDPRVSLAGFFGEWLYVLRDQLDLACLLEQFQVTNGSMSHSPSSSVFMLLACAAAGIQNPGVDRLRAYVRGMNPFIGKMGTLDQAPHFATSWLLLFTELEAPDMPQTEQVNALNLALQPYGKLISTAGDSTFPGDMDTTSCAVVALRLPSAAREAVFRNLEDMFDADHYLTFRHERTPAVTTNVHAVAAWPENPHTPVILDWITAEMERTGGMPRCKWHLSPYYTLGEMARLFADLAYPKATALAVKAGEILLERQQAVGGWGYQEIATVEETCYAILALDKLQRVGLLDHMRVRTAIERGAAFVEASLPDYSALWVGKSLYYVPPLERYLRAQVAQIAGRKTKPITVLYVDDNPDYQFILDTYLSDAEYAVEMVETAESALAYLESKEPDVVILDLVLPGMNGYQALQRIQQLRPGTKVVATTAFYDNQTDRRVRESGFNGYVQKPFDQHTLITYVGRLLDRSA